MARKKLILVRAKSAHSVDIALPEIHSRKEIVPMSHIVSIKTQIRDAAALSAACTRLGLQQPTLGTAELYSSSATGQIVKLLGWSYPVVIDTVKGEISYDNYNGAWGNQVELDKLLQAYAVEKARIEARKAGHTVTESQLPNGSIKLTVQVAGGVA
jgi:hypothetical protein